MHRSTACCTVRLSSCVQPTCCAVCGARCDGTFCHQVLARKHALALLQGIEKCSDKEPGAEDGAVSNHAYHSAMHRCDVNLQRLDAVATTVRQSTWDLPPDPDILAGLPPPATATGTGGSTGTGTGTADAVGDIAKRRRLDAHAGAADDLYIPSDAALAAPPLAPTARHTAAPSLLGSPVGAARRGAGLVIPPGLPPAVAAPVGFPPAAPAVAAVLPGSGRDSYYAIGAPGSGGLVGSGERYGGGGAGGERYPRRERPGYGGTSPDRAYGRGYDDGAAGYDRGRDGGGGRGGYLERGRDDHGYGRGGRGHDREGGRRRHDDYDREREYRHEYGGGRSGHSDRRRASRWR